MWHGPGARNGICLHWGCLKGRGTCTHPKCSISGTMSRPHASGRAHRTQHRVRISWCAADGKVLHQRRTTVFCVESVARTSFADCICCCTNRQRASAADGEHDSQGGASLPSTPAGPAVHGDMDFSQHIIDDGRQSPNALPDDPRYAQQTPSALPGNGTGALSWQPMHCAEPQTCQNPDYSWHVAWAQTKAGGQ